MAHTETIGDRIARLRQARQPKTPQYQLANEIGIHPSSLNQIEKGHRKPNTETVSALAKALGVTRDYLLDGNQAVASPTTQSHEEDPKPPEISAVVSQAVQTAIRATFTDILNAVSESFNPAGRSADAERKDRRSKAKTVRTRRN